MNAPAFDEHGYPTEATEEAIAKWPFDDPPGFLAYVNIAWNHHYGRIWQDGNILKLATGGWSGNESIISAMQNNIVLWSMLWQSSHRGGLTALRLPKVTV